MERRDVRSRHGRQGDRPEARKDMKAEVQPIVAHGGRLLLEFCMLREEAFRQVGHGDRLRDRPNGDGGVPSIVRLGKQLRGLAPRPIRRERAMRAQRLSARSSFRPVLDDVGATTARSHA